MMYNGVMKHLRGHTRRYFSLAVIAIYSTLYKLSRMDTNRRYHKLAWKFSQYKTSPPLRTQPIPGFQKRHS
jgi:hypothetical protein